MSIGVFFAVLSAALLHATWNALVKASADRLVFLAVLKVGSTVFALAALPFIDVPPPEAWPHIAASTVIHTAYFIFLAITYRYGDLSQVYPISRGTAPLIVAVMAAAFLGEVLALQSTLAIVIIAIGVMSLILSRPAGLKQPKTIVSALVTACFIAGYTVVDGVGARVSANAQSYILWLNVFNGLPIILIAVILRQGQIRTQVSKVWKAGILSGVVSLFAYWIVLWAATQAPLALVAAVRESGIMFAVLFGVFFFKEKLNLIRLFSVFTTMTGVVLLKFSQ